MDAERRRPRAFAKLRLGLAVAPPRFRVAPGSGQCGGGIARSGLEELWLRVCLSWGFFGFLLVHGSAAILCRKRWV